MAVVAVCYSGAAIRTAPGYDNVRVRPISDIQGFALHVVFVLKPDMRVNAPFVHDPYQKLITIYTFALPVFST